MLRGWDPGRVLGSSTNPTVEVLESATGHCRGITLHAWLPGDLNSQEEMPSPPRPVHSEFTRRWGVTVKDPLVMLFLRSILLVQARPVTEPLAGH